MKSYYLLIIVVTLLVPVALSFDKAIHFRRKWRYAAWSIGFVSALFLAWDMAFVQLGIWSFSKEYTLGPNILGMPIEEFLYFLALPYLALFIYEALLAHFPRWSFRSVTVSISWILLVACVFVVLQYFSKLYTSITAALIIFTVLNQITITKAGYRSHLYIAWILCCLPLLLINGLMCNLPIIEYNEEHLTGLKLANIPVENFFYLLLYMMWSIALFEKYQRRRERRHARKMARREKRAVQGPDQHTHPTTNH